MGTINVALVFVISDAGGEIRVCVCVCVRIVVIGFISGKMPRNFSSLIDKNI